MAAYLLDIEIHFATLIGKNAQVDDFVYKVIDIINRVFFVNAKKHQQSHINFARDSMFDCDLCFFNIRTQEFSTYNFDA